MCRPNSRNNSFRGLSRLFSRPRQELPTEAGERSPRGDPPPHPCPRDEIVLYRFVSEEEFHDIKALRHIKTSEDPWNPYRRNQVVLLLEPEEGSDVLAVFDRYAPVVADLRALNVDNKLLVLQITGPPGLVEMDRSAGKDWPHSRAHYGDIPVDCVLQIGEGTVTDAKPDFVPRLSPLFLYPDPKSI